MSSQLVELSNNERSFLLDVINEAETSAPDSWPEPLTESELDLLRERLAGRR